MIKFHAIITSLLFLCSCTSSMLVPVTSSGKAPAKAESVKKESSKPITIQHGIASWYSIKTNYGIKTASGRPLSNHAYTAAHKQWPMGSKVRVTNLNNGRSEILTISDRGPYIKGRIIDVTVGSAKRLGFHERGITKTKVELLERGNWKYQH